MKYLILLLFLIPNFLRAMEHKDDNWKKIFQGLISTIELRKRHATLEKKELERQLYTWGRVARIMPEALKIPDNKKTVCELGKDKEDWTKEEHYLNELQKHGPVLQEELKTLMQNPDFQQGYKRLCQIIQARNADSNKPAKIDPCLYLLAHLACYQDK